MSTAQVLTAAVLAASPQPQPLSRAEVVTTDGSSILYAYDCEDDVAAEITIWADGLQASFDGLFIDAELAADGTVMVVECGGEPCSDADLLTAQNQLAAVAELLIQSPPEEFKLRCALSIAAGGAAACECMGSVTVKGKDICDEIL